MTIRRGQDWGMAGPLAGNAAVVATDADVVDALFGTDRSGVADVVSTPAPGDWVGEVGLTGGDLHRTLGSPRHSADDLRRGLGMKMPVDVVAVTFGDGPRMGQTDVFCAHLVATEVSRRLVRRRLFDGHTVVAMNAAFRGTDNLAPRAHPGDGLIDTLEGALGGRDRVRARKRYPTGTHVPHPDIDARRVKAETFEFDSPAQIVLDGRESVRASVFTINCIPDAITLVV